MNNQEHIKTRLSLHTSSHEKMNNYLHELLGDKYALQTVCMSILKDLNQKETLTTTEQLWYDDLVETLFD